MLFYQWLGSIIKATHSDRESHHMTRRGNRKGPNPVPHMSLAESSLHAWSDWLFFSQRARPRPQGQRKELKRFHNSRAILKPQYEHHRLDSFSKFPKGLFKYQAS